MTAFCAACFAIEEQADELVFARRPHNMTNLELAAKIRAAAQGDYDEGIS